MKKPELKQIREELKLKKQYENVKSRYIDTDKLKMHQNLEHRRSTGKPKNFCMINRSRLKDPINFDFQRSMGEYLFTGMSKSIEGSNSPDGTAIYEAS